MHARRASLALCTVLVATLAALGCGGSHKLRAGMDPQYLAQFLQSPRHQERRKAALFLGAARDPRSVGALISALQAERYAHVIVAELEALGYSGAPEAEPVLQQYAAHSHPKIARVAIRALLIHERFAAHYGQPLPVQKGRPMLPLAEAGVVVAPAPVDGPAAAGEEVGAEEVAPPPPPPSARQQATRAAIGLAVVGAGVAADALARQARHQPAPAAGRPAGDAPARGSEQRCYNHECKGARTGRKCFQDRSTYCHNLCQERNCAAEMACQAECR
jgi:hypothetical protein